MSVDGQNLACAEVERLLKLTELSELVKSVKIIK